MSSDKGRILRRLDEFNGPYFAKTLTRSMVRRCERLEIPKPFLQAHGDSIHMVLLLTGPNGQSRPVTLTVRTSITRPRESPRIFLSQGWKAFAIENGFRTGDEIMFCLVRSSEFHVLHSAIAPRQIPDAAEAHTSPRLRFQRLSTHVREDEYINYPGLNSAMTANSKFPQFVKKLILYSKHSLRLELPFGFVNEHGGELQEHVALLGASGHLRVLKLKITTFSGQGRVHLGKGWKQFAIENGLSDGDALLFSLVGLSTFVVKTFPKASK